MNKQLLDEFIPKAYTAIIDNEISDKKNCVSSGFRGQISSFGAAIAMGSLLSAVAAFSQENKSLVDRIRLMNAIYQILTERKANSKDNLLSAVVNNTDPEIFSSERILTASIAIKLALSMFQADLEGPAQ